VEIKFTSLIFKERDLYVAHCPELDVSSCGHVVDEARSNLLEAVDIFINEAKKLGTLEDILAESGFVLADKKHDSWLPPDLVLTERRELSFPSGG